MMEPDENLGLEVLDKSTYDFASEATEQFKKEFGQTSNKIINGLRKYADVPLTIQVSMNDQHVARLYKEQGMYKLVADGRMLASTNRLITWFSVSEDFLKVAYFETDGSDEGTLSILENGSIIESYNGFFSGVTFFEGTYYAIKSFRGDDVPEGVQKNAQRVILNGKIVWGHDVSNSEFIKISKFGSECLVSVGNWMKSTIYRGILNDPGTWKQVHSTEHPANPAGIVENHVYLLEYSGNGSILKDGKKIVEFDQPVEEFSGSLDPVMIVGKEIIAVTLKDAKLMISTYDLDGKKKNTLPVDEYAGLATSCNDGNGALFYATSFGKPEIVYSYSKGKFRKLSENNLLNLELSEGFAHNDDTKVHYFIASSRSAKHDMAVVYGYGGFNVTTKPGYRHIYAYLLSHGVDIIMCNLRGGNEYGEEWHLQGTRENKINVFNDFRAVVEKFRKKGYRIVIDGASNGGLLTSYSLVNFPKLLNGAVIGKPVIDMLRYHKLLAGVYWVNEYGNPDVEEDREFLAAYSPYLNVRDRKYPPSLIWIRMKDDRVHPAHGLKFYKRMMKTGSEAFLRADLTGGHIGLRHETMLDESADIIAFVMRCLDAEPAK
jgi:prolyl oligopeptidase